MGGEVEVGLLIGSMAVKEGGEFEASRAKRKSLEEMRTQERLKATEEGLQREKKLESVLGTQRAEGAARGVSPTSASLSVISEGTFNEFADDETAANMNLKIKESEIDTEEENARRKFGWQTAGNLFDAANRYNNLNVPSSPTASSGAEVDAVMQNYTIRGQHPMDISVGGEGPLDLAKFNQDKVNEFIGF